MVIVQAADSNEPWPDISRRTILVAWIEGGERGIEMIKVAKRMVSSAERALQ